MDLQTLAPWIAALRSGKYSQTERTLHDEKGFCCLGVAADVFKVANLEDMQVSDGATEGPGWVYDELRLMMPPYIMEEGISMNDRSCSFIEIADMIEQKLAQ